MVPLARREGPPPGPVKNIRMTAVASENSRLGIAQISIFWSKVQMDKEGTLPEGILVLEPIDQTLLDCLRLPLEVTLGFVYSQCQTLKEFEDWISRRNPDLDSAAINALLCTEEEVSAAPTRELLTPERESFWAKNGYLIIPQAVPQDGCRAAAQALWEHIGADPQDSSTWYSRPTIMVDLYDHPALESNRLAPKVRQAFAELWNTRRLVASADRVGMNPPETETWKFPGPDLHWDAVLDGSTPPPFGLQGLVYLTDTDSNQGAFTLVPGFHHKLQGWLNSLEPGSDPQQQNLHALGSVPLAAKAGDLIIWHTALPHGSSPNTAKRPRLVQYINYSPVAVGVSTEKH